MNSPSSASPAWLQQLAPAHAQAPPGWWPLAPGWWLLIAMLALCAGLFYAWRRERRSLRRLALNELAQIESSAADDAAVARDLENLMRRYAVVRYGRESVARLSGEAWLAFVATHGGSALAGEPGQQLLRAAYGTQALADRAQWLRGARGFIASRSFGRRR